MDKMWPQKDTWSESLENFPAEPAELSSTPLLTRQQQPGKADYLAYRVKAAILGDWSIGKTR